MIKDTVQSLYQVIAEEAMLGFAVFSQNGNCVYLNKVGRELLETTKPNLEELTPKENRPPFKSFSKELLHHEGLYQDIVIQKHQGSYFIANVGVKRVEVDGTQGNLLMIQDVTLQKKLQREITAKQNEIKSAFEELLKQNKQLKELDVAKDRFIALTTHELRTPIAAMFSASEILKLELYDSPDQMKEFINMIYDQGLHLQELVNDILDFAKIQAGRMDFYVEEKDINPCIQSIVDGFQGMAESMSVTMNLETPAQPTICYYDEMRIRQVVSNIVNNAIKYNRKGGAVTIRFKEEAECVRIFVQDTGKGIAKESFDKVFNEFETLGQVNTHHKGTGLGMPISRKLIEGMGGKLLLDSELGVGSTFWVEIPKTKILADDLYRARPNSTSGDLAA